MTTDAIDGVIAIIRLRETTVPDEAFTALVAGGVRWIEVTVDTPGALAAVSRWRELGQARVGVGTVRTAEHALRAAEAGAQFLVTPTVQAEVLDTARQHDVPVVCGALSPTEIDVAWQGGARAVKVFPVDAVGGPQYVNAVRAPLPDVPLVPTGGVTPALAEEYARLGCAGVGVATSLVDEATVRAGDWAAIERSAAAFVQAWEAGRDR